MMKQNDNNLFWVLVRAALGSKYKFCRIPTEKEWNALYKQSLKQAISGVVFEAIKRLNDKEMKPPFPLLMEWIAVCEQIRLQNQKCNQAVIDLYSEFNKEGFCCCLLKGQGNNLLYPNFFSRVSGDIDLWITPSNKRFSEKHRKQVCLNFLRSKYPQGFLHYNHIDAGFYNGIPVEIHHRPRFLNNMIHNKRLQKWISSKREEQFRNYVRLPQMEAEIAIPTWEFNVVFQVAHIYGHLLQSGIGLRHLIDYFYLLKSNERCDNDKEKITKTLCYLGLEKIVEAVMWVLNEILGLPEEYLIAPMDERRGKVLLDEIMRGGNFGHFDSDNINATSRLKMNVQRFKRDLRLMRYFPSECIWEPWFRVYHLFWRMAH